MNLRAGPLSVMSVSKGIVDIVELKSSGWVGGGVLGVDREWHVSQLIKRIGITTRALMQFLLELRACDSRRIEGSFL